MRGRRGINCDGLLAIIIGLSIFTFLFQAPFTDFNQGDSNTLVRWWDVAYLLILLTGAFYAIRHRSIPRATLRRLIDPKDPLFWAIVLTAFAALSLRWAWIDFGSSGFVAEAMRVARLGVAIVVALLLRYGFRDPKFKSVGPISIIVFSTITAYWAWAAWLILEDQRPIPPQTGVGDFGVTRAGGPYGNFFANGLSDHSWASPAAANIAGFFIAVAFAVALVWGVRTWHARKHREAIVWTLATVVLLGGLIATHSRESIVAALAATLVLGGAASRRTGWKPALAAIGMAALAMLLIVLFVPSFGDRFLESFKPGSFEYRTGPEARLDAWWNGLEWGARRFPIGYGIGVIEEHPGTFGGATSENVFIQTWAQVGLLGLLSLVAVVATAIYNTAIAVRRNATLPVAFSLSFFTAFLVHGQLGNTLWDPTLLIGFGVALAFAGPLFPPNRKPATPAAASPAADKQ